MDTSNGDDNAICLPYDVLLDILGRLPVRPLAGCRRVCRAWRAIVDAHDLLRPYYFPTGDFPGIFVTKLGCQYSACSFFGPCSSHNEQRYCKPSSRRPVYPHKATIHSCCNGLLFLEDSGNYFVFNPATARYARLLCGLCPSTKFAVGAMSLAFDPAVSLHYDVFLLHEDALVQKWTSAMFGEPDLPFPPEKVIPLEVYSSRTGQWEIREFTPGRCAPGHLYDMIVRSSNCYQFKTRFWLDDTYERMIWSSHYWRDSLYMHSRENVLIILHSSKRTYEMIQLPGKLPCGGSAEIRYPLPKHSVLASYDRGIHYVTISDELQLQVWILLTESTDGQLSWILAHDASLQLHVDMAWFLEPTNVTWRVIGSRNGPVNLIKDGSYGNVEEDRAGAYDSDYSWNSDEENFADVLQGSVWSVWRSDCRIIGFHPHKNALITC
jgi:hypothetical protein